MEDVFMCAINFREYLKFDKSYCTINREERNLTTILFHILLENNNIEIFLNDIGIKKTIDMKSTSFGIYPEYAFIRDLCDSIDKCAEANKLKIPVVCLADTNANPDGIDYLIPGNDDAIRSIKLIASKLADAVLEGKSLKDNKANTTKKIQSIKAEDAGVEAVQTEASTSEVAIEIEKAEVEA
jgi:small subunit ribosomal protein S2